MNNTKFTSQKGSVRGRNFENEIRNMKAKHESIISGKTSEKLEAHHMNGKEYHPEQERDINNIALMTRAEHTLYHEIFEKKSRKGFLTPKSGQGHKDTKADFKAFMKFCSDEARYERNIKAINNKLARLDACMKSGKALFNYGFDEFDIEFVPNRNKNRNEVCFECGKDDAIKARKLFPDRFMKIMSIRGGKYLVSLHY